MCGIADIVNHQYNDTATTVMATKLDLIGHWGPDAPGMDVHHVKRIFKRDRTPVYPYSAKGPGRKGWSSYIGFVPYSWGNVENEAIQRGQYPMRYWPHNPNAPLPRPYR